VTEARVLAQAKVNLVLHILAREATGYHSIETVFLRLDLADDVRVRLANGRSLDCRGAAIPPAGLGPVEKNLAYRAAVAYSDAVGWPNGFAIEVDKRIPVGAGLGGGSADAGAVLRALDAMSPNPLGPRLIELATPLGADVPFMTIESPMALGWGRGERLFPVPALEPRDVAIVVPNFPISTPDAYNWLASDRGTYAPTAGLLTPESLATWEEVVAVATNDFEAPVARRHPVIAEIADGLESMDALVAMMSGSGSTVFGVFAASPDVAAITRSIGFSTIATRTSDRVFRVEID
jgi:4-diphosphocytidyl-2-C-methyl-D-erythritol kinase